MQTQWRLLHIPNLGARMRWVVSTRLQLLYLPGNTQYPLCWRLSVPYSWFGRHGNPCLNQDLISDCLACSKFLCQLLFWPSCIKMMIEIYKGKGQSVAGCLASVLHRQF